VSPPLDLNDPIAVLLAVARALRDAGIANAAYGGLALAAYGEPRETKDVDLAVVGVPGKDGEAALRTAGLDVALAFDRVRFGGNLVTRLTLLGGGGLNMADLVAPCSERFARVVLERAVEGVLRAEPLRVVSPEDFVLLKVLSTRERDLEDAASLLRSPALRLDTAVVEDEVSRLAAEIAEHDVAGRWRRVVEMARR
jgi:hypothetical protein